MANIEIKNINLNGLELFDDLDDLITELNEDEISLINGNGLSVYPGIILVQTLITTGDLIDYAR